MKHPPSSRHDAPRVHSSGTNVQSDETPMQCPDVQVSFVEQLWPSLQPMPLQTGSAQSMSPLQSSSMPLAQFSVAPGCTAAFVSLQSVPPLDFAR